MMYTAASPDMILAAYAEGIFPMAESADSPEFAFYRPVQRGQLSIPALRIPSRLRKTLRRAPFAVSVDRAFAAVVDGCADASPVRRTTWINPPIRDVFVKLHERGHAHSVECWTHDGMLAGGIYGLAMGRVFCGESMFSRKTDASKIALVHLCARLSAAGFTVFDTQFINPHLIQFGAYEIAQEDYERLIVTEMRKPAHFKGVSVPQETLIRDYLSALGSASGAAAGGGASSSSRPVHPRTHTS